MEKRITAIAGWVFIISAFLIPLLFSTSPIVAFPFVKVILLFIATFIVAFLFVIQVFNQGKITLPVNWLFAFVALVPLVYLVSSFTSVSPSASLIGMGTETGTASFIACLFLFMALIAYFMRAKDKAFNACLAFVVAYVILSVFHLLRFTFGADFLSFGVFTEVVSNTIGRFTDLGIVSGIVVILSLISIEFLRLSKTVRVIGYAVLGLSLIMLCFTNFPFFIWGTDPGDTLSLFTFVGFFALTFFVYFISLSYGKQEGRDMPIASLVVLVISVAFTFGAVPLQNLLSSAAKIESGIETRLLWKPTAEIVHSTLSQFSVRPFLGYGPEQFAYKWMLDKPAAINNTVLWNTPFSEGSGFIPSAPVTVGILGFLAWVGFLVLLARSGIQSLFSKNKDHFSNYLTTSFFLVSVYLWVAAIVYVPSVTTFILTFFFTGLFLASLFREKVIQEKEFVFDDSKSKSFVYIMLLIIALLFMLFWVYKIGERVAAEIYANRANIALSVARSSDDVEKVKVYLRSAAALANEGFYSRELANLTLAQVNNLIQDTVSPQEQLKERFQVLYPEAVGYAQNAVAKDPNSFDSSIAYGNVLVVGASLNFEGYAAAAKAAYERAGELNPKSPLVHYLIARLEVEKQNIDAAKAKIGEALHLKPDYLEAIVYLGRIQIGEGRNQDALNSFIVAQSIDRSNEDIQAAIDLLRTKVSAPPASKATSTKQ